MNFKQFLDGREASASRYISVVFLSLFGVHFLFCLLLSGPVLTMLVFFPAYLFFLMYASAEFSHVSGPFRLNFRHNDYLSAVSLPTKSGTVLIDRRQLPEGLLMVSFMLNTVFFSCAASLVTLWLIKTIFSASVGFMSIYLFYSFCFSNIMIILSYVVTMRAIPEGA